MALKEDIENCLTLANSMSTDKPTAQNAPLQQLGALLASKCEKICIGPSYHLYTRESNFSPIMGQRIEASPEMMCTNEEECETIFYPDTTHEENSTLPLPYLQCESDENDKSIIENPTVDIKLANAHKFNCELLTPDYFVSSASQSTSSSSSSKSDKTSSMNKFGFIQNRVEISNDIQHMSLKDKIPNQYKNEESSQNLERYEIIECPEEEEEFEELPTSFIEHNNVCLGIEPGVFYKSRAGVYVKLPHRSHYDILVTNRHQVPCNVDIYVDEKITFLLRINPGRTSRVQGPSYSDQRFRIFRSSEAPPNCGVMEGMASNGIVKAIFTLGKIDDDDDSVRTRASSAPINCTTRLDNVLDFLEDQKETKPRSVTVDDPNSLERALDINQITEGVTLLQGKQKNQQFIPAPPIDLDEENKITLVVRLVASLNEESERCDEKIFSIIPPPIPSRKATI